MNLAWTRRHAAAPNETFAVAARHRQSRLTKPEGSLGRLEEIAVTLAAIQGRPRPRVDRVYVVVFVADHGVTAERVSAYPQVVTGQMLVNIVTGGAAVSVLTRALGAELEVVDVGCVCPPDSEQVVSARAGRGTTNFVRDSAMSPRQLALALDAGRDAARRARAKGTELFIGGETGIGNSTSAAALACALLDVEPRWLVGPGTGLGAKGVARKIDVVARGLHRHRNRLTPPLAALESLGGFEIAALTGAFIDCAQHRLPVLVDGFIAAVAALAAVRLCPGSERWFLHGHRSREPGHSIVLDALGAMPLLDLGMRLGEGSGALAALPLLRLACELHGAMATFDEAGVSVAHANR